MSDHLSGIKCKITKKRWIFYDNGLTNCAVYALQHVFIVCPRHYMSSSCRMA
jgi:hypothetical protein